MREGEGSHISGGRGKSKNCWPHQTGSHVSFPPKSGAQTRPVHSLWHHWPVTTSLLLSAGPGHLLFMLPLDHGLLHNNKRWIFYCAVENTNQFFSPRIHSKDNSNSVVFLPFLLVNICLWHVSDLIAVFCFGRTQQDSKTILTITRLMQCGLKVRFSGATTGSPPCAERVTCKMGWLIWGLAYEPYMWSRLFFYFSSPCICFNLSVCLQQSHLA